MILFALVFSFSASAQDEDVLPSGADENAKAYRKCLDRIIKDNCYEKYGAHTDENPVLSRNSSPESIAACMANRETPSDGAAKCYKNAFQTSASNPMIQTASGRVPSSAADEVAPVPTPKAAPKATPAAAAPTAAAPKPAAAPTPTGSAGPSVDDAQNQVNADLQSCINMQNNASKCCYNPLSCAGSLNANDKTSLAQMMQANNGPAAGQSMTEYCSQLKQASTNSGSVNSGLATTCATNQSSCYSTCKSLMDKYTDLQNANRGKDVESVYASAADQFMNATNTCSALQSKANQLATQGIGTNNANNYATACEQMASANPQTPPTNSNPLPTNTAATRASLDGQNCKANPNAAECKSQTAQSGTGSSAFSETAKNMGNFDVPDAPAGSGDWNGQARPQSAGGAKVNGVPNNSGGGFGGGGSPTSAQLGGGNQRPSSGSPGYTTDILQGVQGGGGYSAPASGSGFEDSSASATYGYAQQRAPRADDGGMLGMDLRKYLPGGSRDPHRQLAGVGRRSEINAKEEDIWRRISNKMIEKCKLGVLWRCQ